MQNKKPNHTIPLSKKTMKRLKNKKFHKRVVMTSFGCMAVIALGSYFAADREAPTIKETTKTVAFGTKLSKSDVVVQDNREDRKNLVIKIDKSQYNAKKLGTYKVKVQVTDSFNNTTKKTMKVNVVDRESPVVKGNKTKNGEILVEAGGSNDLSHYLTITDNVDGNLFKKAKFSKTLDTKKTGLQIIDVEVRDSSGNETRQSLKFRVIDSQAPTILHKYTTNVLNYGDTLDYAKYFTVNDNYDENLKIVPIGTVDSKKIGDQKVTISATDTSGQTTKEEVTFEVKDMTGPKITFNKEVTDNKTTVELNKDFDPLNLITSVEDNKDGTLDKNNVKVDGSVDTKKTGDYDLTYTISDEAGNKTTQKVTVHVSDEGSAMIAYGQKYLNVPYVFGGTTPSGFDCSGFTGWVYKKFGKSLPRTAAAQYDATTRVDRDQLQKGDLVFFSNTYKPGISHVGIYIGDNKMIDASGDHVQIDSLSEGYWSAHYSGAGRYKAK